MPSALHMAKFWQADGATILIHITSALCYEGMILPHTCLLSAFIRKWPAIKKSGKDEPSIALSLTIINTKYQYISASLGRPPDSL